MSSIAEALPVNRLSLKNHFDLDISVASNYRAQRHRIKDKETHRERNRKKEQLIIHVSSLRESIKHDYDGLEKWLRAETQKHCRYDESVHIYLHALIVLDLVYI